MTEGRAATFYTRYAGLYDRIATDAPFVARLRERVVDALDLGRGDVVVEMGCGTGANLPVLRDRVGRGGTVIGLDVSAGVVERARNRIRRAGWRNVHVARADATRSPLGVGGADDGTVPSEVDGVLATFVTGMLPDPAGAVDDWIRLVADTSAERAESGPVTDRADRVDRPDRMDQGDRPDRVDQGDRPDRVDQGDRPDRMDQGDRPDRTTHGRICVAGFGRSTHPVGRLANPAFGGLVRLATPPGRDGGHDRPGSPVDLLDERALAAHRRVHRRCSDVTTTRHLAGFARITAGTVGAETTGPNVDGAETTGPNAGEER